MEVIREFLDKNFKTIVTEIEGNYQVTFQGVGGQEGYVTFRRAKVGWTLSRDLTRTISRPKMSKPYGIIFFPTKSNPS